jgi:uncharacterized SAM-binding protein YcdF (DUF218 family)
MRAASYLGVTMQGAPAPTPTPLPNATPPLERVVTPPSSNDIDWQSLLIAGFGATCALLTWLVVGALTGLGKVPSLLFPGAMLVALVGAVVGLTRAAVILWVLTAAALVAFCTIAMTSFVTRVLPTSAMVRRDNLPAQPLDAVVVLSGGITPDGMLVPEALDRLLTGLALMRDNVAPVLVVTEPRRPGQGVTAAADQARVRALVARSFPMLMVDSVHTTRDEAVNAWRLLEARNAKNVAVVTSPLHTRRACATFEQVGFVVTCVPAISRVYSVTGADNGSDRLTLFREWLYERAAWFEYRARGWVATPGTR